MTFDQELSAPTDWRLSVYQRDGGAATHERRSPPRHVIDAILGAQGNICLYCQIPIGTQILRTYRQRERLVRLMRNWDHFVPYAYVARNPDLNWTIACHVCNRIKFSNVFTTTDEARTYVLPKREELGYEPTWSVLRRINLRSRPVRAPSILPRPEPRSKAFKPPICAGQIWARRSTGCTVRVEQASRHWVFYVTLASPAFPDGDGKPGQRLSATWHDAMNLISAAPRFGEGGGNA